MADRILRAPQDGRARRRRVFTYAVLAGSAIFLVNALVGEHGYLAGVRSQRDAEAISEEVTKLNEQNKQLREQAERLKHDPAALEEAARRDLGLVKPGEAVVVIHDAQPAASSASGKK